MWARRDRHFATPSDRVTVTHLGQRQDWHEQLARDVREGLGHTPKTLPPKYFYDATGSALFEDITQLPEYYQTRTETAILQRVASDVITSVAPVELIELGSGSSRKTRLLLEAMHAAGCGDTYAPIDVSEDAVRGAALRLTADYPWLHVAGFVGDFERDLGAVPRTGPALVAFLGSTIGNLRRDEQAPFLGSLARSMRPADRVLVGFDLAPTTHGKTIARLVAAYDDAAGVTAAFNRNVLHVLRRDLGAEVDVAAFGHVARYDDRNGWIEMLLRADRDIVVRVPRIGLEVAFPRGETIRTEISCKFTRAQVDALFAAAGLLLERWDTDPDGWFALALARPASRR
jgi:L-histidine N-alpha-methyltransferase